MILEWRRPFAKLDSYKLVYVSADGHRAEDMIAGSFESHTLKGLTPGMLYTISISAERGRRSSVPATISAPTGQRGCIAALKSENFQLSRSFLFDIIVFLNCLAGNAEGSREEAEEGV